MLTKVMINYFMLMCVIMMEGAGGGFYLGEMEFIARGIKIKSIVRLKMIPGAHISTSMRNQQ